MNAAESQQILSRLYTDAEYRNAFLLDKDGFYVAYQIKDPETVAFLNAIKPGQLEFFTKGLYSKKYHEVLRIISGTACLLKPKIGALFNEFSKTPATYGLHKHHEETLAFITFIRKNGSLTAALKDMLKFEEIRILNFLRPQPWSVSAFSYDLPEFLGALHDGQDPVMKKKKEFIIFKNGRIIKRIVFGF
jgi:hypothetical protein